MFSLYIGENKLDLFGDENIELTQQIGSVSDITKNLGDLTKSFSVSASESNNSLFKHYYNANIDNTFDARTKVEGRIELNGMPFSYGKYRLEKVIVRKGKPYSYTLQYWGNFVNIKDKFKNDELSVLDLSAYNHIYNSVNVKTGLTSSLFGGDLVYVPLVKKQYYYNDNGTDNTYTSKLANVAFNNGGSGGMNWNDFKPSLKLLPIIEAIENKYNLLFSRDFFGREEFSKLYLWINNTSSASNGDTKIVNFNSGSNDFVNFTTDIGTYNPTRVFSDIFTYKRYTNTIRITPNVGFEDVEYKVRYYKKNNITDSDFVLISENSLKGNFVKTDSISAIISPANEISLYFEIETLEAFSYTTRYTQVEKISTGFGTETSTTYETYGSDTLTSSFIVSNNLPKLKIIDFFAGLFKMFKLVVIAQDDGTIYVNTLKDYYAEGRVWNLTKYIDYSSYDVERGKLLNPINFNFKEPQTLLNIQFEANTGQYYGDEELILEDEDGEQLDGESYDVQLPFEQIVYERLVNINTNGTSYFMYGGVFNESIDEVNPSAHLHYVQNTPLNGTGLSYVNDLGVKELLATNINIANHSIAFDNPQFSLVWGKEVSEWSGDVIQNTLYSNYYSDYITSVFNIKRRSFKFTAKNIPLRIRLSLKLNDVIEIKQNYYRIDNFTTNLLTGVTSFNLINSFDNAISGFSADRTIINTDYTAKSESIYVTNGGNFSFNKVDIGDGVGWVTVSSSGSNVYFEFTENIGVLNRGMQVELTNTLTFQTITITLNQGISGNYTVDTTLIMADNAIITADNF